MLLKASARAATRNMLLGSSIMASQRIAGVHTIAGKNYVIPTSARDCITTLDKRRPTYTCVYFHAAWNPICNQIDKDYDSFCDNNAGWYHMKVDCDSTPHLKFYFDAR